MSNRNIFDSSLAKPGVVELAHDYQENKLNNRLVGVFFTLITILVILTFGILFFSGPIKTNSGFVTTGRVSSNIEPDTQVIITKHKDPYGIMRFKNILGTQEYIVGEIVGGPNGQLTPSGYDSNLWILKSFGNTTTPFRIAEVNDDKLLGEYVVRIKLGAGEYGEYYIIVPKENILGSIPNEKEVYSSGDYKTFEIFSNGEEVVKEKVE